MKLGVEVFLSSDLTQYKKLRWGLVFHTASILSNFKSSDIVLSEQLNIRCLFGPQHGAFGEKQDNMIETKHVKHPKLGIPLYSLYSETRKPTDEMIENIDGFIFDLQDVGCRVYTYIHTLFHIMEVASQKNKKVLILDRPNPLGNRVIGDILDLKYRSFVGLTPIPMQHGMTVGELAKYFNTLLDVSCDLKVIPMHGYKARLIYDQLDLPYVLPSPNLSCLEAIHMYPGNVLFEGTLISEGRGTTWPFLLIGVPGIDPYLLCEQMPEFEGINFRPYFFEPTFQKYKSQICAGIQCYPSNPNVLNSHKFAITLLSKIYALFPKQFAWLNPPYEYEYKLMPIDILTGGENVRMAVEGKIPLDKLWELYEEGEKEWNETRKPFSIEQYQ